MLVDLLTGGTSRSGDIVDLLMIFWIQDVMEILKQIQAGQDPTKKVEEVEPEHESTDAFLSCLETDYPIPTPGQLGVHNLSEIF